MRLLGKILLPVDFLPSCDNVVGNAIGLAQAFHSDILLLHVLPDEVKDPKARALLERSARENLDLTRHRIESEGVNTLEPLLEWGLVDDHIIRAAERLKANLILIGAGEKDGGNNLQLGSIAEKIIRQSSQPVWVVKPGQQLNVRTILCPVEFSDQSARALRDAIILARRFEAELIILSVYQPITASTFSFKYDWENENTRIALTHLREYNDFLQQFKLKDLTWHKEVRWGRPELEILEEIMEKNIDLLIMGTTGRSGLSRVIIGSVTEKVIREVPCTFITTKAQDVIQLQLENRIRDIESHYQIAMQLMKDGFYQESINEFLTCLKINDMHVPSLHGIAKVYDKLENKESAETYRKLAREVMRRIWDSKIEAEIRKYYSH